MNKALSFARLDFLTVKPYLTLKNMLILLFLFGFIGYSTGDASKVTGMLLAYGTIYASYPFVIGDKNGTDTLYATLPLKKSDVVAGRYIFAFSLNLCVAVAAFAGAVILAAVLKKNFDAGETLLMILICYMIFSALEAVQLILYFKLGYAKAKFLVYLSFVAFPVAIVATATLMGKEKLMPFAENIFLWVQANRLMAGALIGVTWILIILGSGLLAYRFYRKREF